MPEGASEADIKVTVLNIPVGYKVIIAPYTGEKIFYNDTDNDTVEFRYTETEAWAEFIWNGTKWLVNDNSNVLSGTFSGAMTFTGPITPSGGIVGKTDGVAVAAGYVGEMLGSEDTGTGGSSYYVSSTTAITATPADLVTITLKKGSYFASFRHDFLSPDATARTATYTIKLGGTSISPTPFVCDKTQNYQYAAFSWSVPILVNADDTVLSLFGGCGALSGTALNNLGTISIVRIA